MYGIFCVIRKLILLLVNHNQSKFSEIPIAPQFFSKFYITYKLKYIFLLFENKFDFKAY